VESVTHPVGSQIEPNAPLWAAAIIASRETLATVTECVRALGAASRAAQTPILIDLIVNGNAVLAEQAAVLAHAPSAGVQVRVWGISRGDKAHAWNEYVHAFWPGADTTFFIDGYVRVNENALGLLDDGLRAHPACLAATGVPTEGRTATAHRLSMIAGGGIHGNMHAIRASAIEQMRSEQFRLPVGLYRTDSLIGGAMAFRFAPAQFPWNVRLCYVAETASWSLINMQTGIVSVLRTYWKRKLRQAQGELENLAVREHMALQRRPPRELPACSKDLVLKWVKVHPAKVRNIILRRPLVALALYRLRRSGAVSGIPSVTRRMGAS
jgi:hypothetical protein